MSQETVFALSVFVLALFAGLPVITKVPPMLHTPLMSGSNAISGIAVIGAILVSVPEQGAIATALGLVAVIGGTVNVVGGYLVTDRMLRMFRKSPTSK